MTYNPEKSKEYSEKLELNEELEDENIDWNKLKSIIENTAEEVIGLKDKTARVPPKEYSIEVQKMVDERKELRMMIDKTLEPKEIEKLRKKRNRLAKEIRKELQNIRERNINEIIEEIDSAPNDMKMYKAIRALREPREIKRNIVVFDDEGKSIVNKEKRYKAVKEHFKSQFYDETEEEIEQFIGNPRPLIKKITLEEVEKALQRMSNNRASGEDGIAAELLKHSPSVVKETIARMYNLIFEEHNENMGIGDSILTPIPKPGKTKVPERTYGPSISST